MRYLSVVTASMFGSLIAITAVLLFSFLFILLLAAGSSGEPPIRSNSVLVAPLSGSIPEVASGDPLAQIVLGEAPYGLFDVTQAIRRAGRDERIDALWLQLGVTSMSWASLQTTRRAVLSFKASGKPVYASSTMHYMSEKEYFLASAADSIFLDPESLFEMNGFVASTTYFSELLDRLHVAPQIVRAGSYKSATEPFTQTSMSEETRLQTTALLRDVSDIFISRIAESRRIDQNLLRSRLDSEAVMMATIAVENDYIDGLIYDDQIRDRLLTETNRTASDKLREVSLVSYVRDTRRRSVRSNDEIAVVHVTGTMTVGKSSDVPNPLFGGATAGSDSFIKALRRARESRKTRAVVVRINSPGGQASAADAMLREIRNTAETLPVVISMGDVAASGGYWIATGAPTIVAEPLTITGSIGVFSLFFDVSGLFEDHLGITFDDAKTNPYADMLSGVRSYRPEEVRMMQDYADETYETFIGLVAASRNLSVEQVRDIADGRVWTGTSALEHRLVDELGGLEAAISLATEQAELLEVPVQIREYPAPLSFWQRFSAQTRLALDRIGLLPLQPRYDHPALPGIVAKTYAPLAYVLQEQGNVQARLPFQFDAR